MWDQQSDPLAIGLQSRARQKRLDYYNGAGFGHMGTVLPDPKWDGFFQAMDEAGVSNLADSSVGIKKGMWSPGAPQGGTYDPRYQSSAVDAMSPSRQLGVPGANVPSSVQALLRKR